MDYIHITNLLFRGKHGFYEAELINGQEFLIEIKLGVDTTKAGVSDKLTDTVDYSEIKNKIREVIEGERRYLIEALAEDVARKILEDKRIKSAEVTVKKTKVWDNGIPGVTILRENN